MVKGTLNPGFTNTSRERANQILPLHINSLSISVFLCRVHVAFVPVQVCICIKK